MSEEKKSNRFDDLKSRGRELIENLPEGVLNSMSDKVILKEILSTPSHIIKRNRKEGEEVEVSYRPIGVLVEFKEDFDKVPSLPIDKNEETGITLDDVTNYAVKAGQEVQLTMYELMMLIITPEFGGSILTHDGVRVNFAPNATKFNKGKAKLPTPAISIDGKKLNDYYKLIAEVDMEEKREVLLSGYDDKFNHFLKKKRQPNESKFTNSTKISLGLYDSLYKKN